MRLTIIPLTLEEANDFVAYYHRHSDTVQGHKFSLGVVDQHERIRGVAIVGRPVSRRLDDGFTLEVLRLASDGCPNACSKLYGASLRAIFALGFVKAITYTLQSEPGTSLKAAGWKCIGEAGARVGQSWSVASRPRVEKRNEQPKLRWEVYADSTGAIHRKPA